MKLISIYICRLVYEQRVQQLEERKEQLAHRLKQREEANKKAKQGKEIKVIDVQIGKKGRRAPPKPQVPINSRQQLLKKLGLAQKQPTRPVPAFPQPRPIRAPVAIRAVDLVVPSKQQIKQPRPSPKPALQQHVKKQKAAMQAKSQPRLFDDDIFGRKM